MCISSKFNISVNYKEVNRHLKYIYNYQQIPIIGHEIIGVRVHKDSKSNFINTNNFVLIVSFTVSYDLNDCCKLLHNIMV